MNSLLNQNVCDELRAAINDTDIFLKDPIEHKNFSFVCAVMDRFDSCVNYINSHSTFPENEFDFITFMSACCCITDGIEQIYSKFNLSLPISDSYFKDICLDNPINVLEADYTGDDRFFKYFRSLVFAHPFETTWSIPNKKAGEEQYSPYVLLDKYEMKFKCETVGAMVYTNLSDEYYGVVFPFQRLKDYIVYKYNLLSNITIVIRKIITDKENIWKFHKVDRTKDELGILIDVKSILEERYIGTYNIMELISYYSCESTLDINDKSVSIFKLAIENKINDICDAVDSYNHEEVFKIIYSLTSRRPKAPSAMYYQLEKIYSYLDNDSSCSNVRYAIMLAKEFANGFAKKWVTYDFNNMSLGEIKLLTTVACYLEYMDQNKGGT